MPPLFLRPAAGAGVMAGTEVFSKGRELAEPAPAVTCPPGSGNQKLVEAGIRGEFRVEGGCP